VLLLRVLVVDATASPETPAGQPRVNGQLFATVNGRLVATVPIETPCHDPNYNEVACAALQSNWTLTQLQFVYHTVLAIHVPNLVSSVD